MKYYNWTEKIDAVSFSKFTDFLNNNKDEKLTVYFQTVGGESGLSKALVSLFNKTVSHVIVTGRVYSAGMNIILNLTTKLSLSTGVMGMIHFTILEDVVISSQKCKAVYTDDIWRIKNLKGFKKRTLKMAKKNTNKKRAKKIK